MSVEHKYYETLQGNPEGEREESEGHEGGGRVKDMREGGDREKKRGGR